MLRDKLAILIISHGIFCFKGERVVLTLFFFLLVLYPSPFILSLFRGVVFLDVCYVLIYLSTYGCTWDSLSNVPTYKCIACRCQSEESVGGEWKVVFIATCLSLGGHSCVTKQCISDDTSTP